MKKTEKTWKIIDLLKATEGLLREKKIDNPRLNAELLLCDTLKTKRIDLYLEFEKPLNETELASFREKVKRRLNREPLQYITGTAEFYGLVFRVNPSVLIPRPETELLVDKTLDTIHMQKLENPKILEIGTGSGCISIALASKVVTDITAIDSSKDALKIAHINSDSHKTLHKIIFLEMDLLNDFDSFNGYDLIISNPPYISMDQMPTLQEEVKNYEPKHALTDNSDGLEFYRKIIDLAKKTPGKLRLLLEIGDGKKEKVEDLLIENGIKNYEFFKDLMKINRVVYIEL